VRYISGASVSFEAESHAELLQTLNACADCIGVDFHPTDSGFDCLRARNVDLDNFSQAQQWAEFRFRCNASELNYSTGT
jgi:hypothetical protein